MLRFDRPSEQLPKFTLLVGPLPHRPDGISVAFDLVVRGFKAQGLPHRVVDIGSTESSRRVGTFTLSRAFEMLRSVVQYWRYLLPSQQVYLLVGLSRAAFLRDLLIVWSAHLLGRRVVLHVHSGGYGLFHDAQPRWIKKLVVETLLCADAIVVLGELLREQVAFLANADAIVRVVPNGLPFEPESDSAANKALHPLEPIRLLYLSNLIETKGYLDCLEACRILYQERGIPVRFDFCGGFVQHMSGSIWKSGQEAADHFSNEIKRLDLADVVTYHGIVTGVAKEQFLSEAHVFILPTYYDWEGQPISIIEAMAFGMPVIATRFRGIPELVVDNHNGFLVEPRNPEGIADCVERMWNEPDRYSLMSVNARRLFEQNFTQQAHLERLVPIILGYTTD